MTGISTLPKSLIDAVSEIMSDGQKESERYNRLLQEHGVTSEKELSESMGVILRSKLVQIGHGNDRTTVDSWTPQKKSISEASGPSRKHFQQVADVIKAHPDQAMRNALAAHHAGIFKTQNPRFDSARFHKAANADLINEEESLSEAEKKKLEESKKEPVETFIAERIGGPISIGHKITGKTIGYVWKEGKEWKGAHAKSGESWTAGNRREAENIMHDHDASLSYKAPAPIKRSYGVRREEALSEVEKKKYVLTPRQKKDHYEASHFGRKEGTNTAPGDPYRHAKVGASNAEKKEEIKKRRFFNKGFPKPNLPEEVIDESMGDMVIHVGELLSQGKSHDEIKKMHPNVDASILAAAAKSQKNHKVKIRTATQMSRLKEFVEEIKEREREKKDIHETSNEPPNIQRLTNQNEEPEDSKSPPISVRWALQRSVRSHYAQTYPKALRGAAKGNQDHAKELAYASVDHRFGPEVRKKLQAWHDSNRTQREGKEPPTDPKLAEKGDKKLLLGGEKTKDKDQKNVGGHAQTSDTKDQEPAPGKTLTGKSRDKIDIEPTMKDNITGNDGVRSRTN